MGSPGAQLEPLDDEPLLGFRPLLDAGRPLLGAPAAVDA